MTPARFITLEGGEGAGKSTQVKRLVDFLRAHGIKAIGTREVGGCPSAEDIRALWLGAVSGHWDVLTEVLLIMAARREHLVRTIWPAIEQGAWVVSDRFVDSTRAYQGMGLGLGLEKIDAVYREIAGDFMPDLTIVLDLPVEAGFQRVALRKGPDDRYEQQKMDFHQKLRDAYHQFAGAEPDRFRIIDAQPTVDQVALSLAEVVQEKFGLL